MNYLETTASSGTDDVTDDVMDLKNDVIMDSPPSSASSVCSFSGTDTSV